MRADRHETWVVGATSGLVRISALGALAGLSIEIGRRSFTHPSLAVVGAAALAVAVLAVIDPVVVATLVVPGVFLIQRVGGGGIDLSASDALLVVGTIVAFPLVPWKQANLRRVLHMIFAFQACLLLTVLVHPTEASGFEWGHRLFLTAGSVMVGAALAAAGRTRVVLGMFMIVAAAVGCLSAAASVANGFGPGYVLGFHKNFVGSMTLTGLAVGYLAPTYTSLSGRPLTIAKILCAVGLLGSQSRGAIVALLLGLLVASIRSPAVWRRSSALLVVLVPLTLFAFFSLRSQLEVAPGETSSITERTRYREQAMTVWRESPIVGQGMRFFKNGEFVLGSDPHNVVVASLSETGIVGLVALVALLAGATRVLWGMHSTLALAALTVLVARFVNGLFDIYWVAGTQSLPWIIVGLALGQHEAEADREVPPLAAAGSRIVDVV